MITISHTRKMKAAKIQGHYLLQRHNNGCGSNSEVKYTNIVTEIIPPSKYDKYLNAIKGKDL